MLKAQVLHSEVPEVGFRGGLDYTSKLKGANPESTASIFSGGPSSVPINGPPGVGHQVEGVDVSSPLWNKTESKSNTQQRK